MYTASIGYYRLVCDPFTSLLCGDFYHACAPTTHANLQYRSLRPCVYCVMHSPPFVQHGGPQSPLCVTSSELIDRQQLGGVSVHLEHNSTISVHPQQLISRRPTAIDQLLTPVHASPSRRLRRSSFLQLQSSTRPLQPARNPPGQHTSAASASTALPQAAHQR